MRILPLLLLLAVCLILTAGKLLNETINGMPEKATSRIDPVITAALIAASIVTSPGNPPNTWELPSGTKINADNCWMDGGGACPNGNCLDNNGQRGIPIKTIEVSCRGCFRGCRKQLCCKEQANWANTWDGSMNFECPRGQGIYRIRSHHDNKREDRIWKFTCKKVSMTNNCGWSGNANGWDGVMNFKCPRNGIITGVQSWHHNHHEDRIWRYRCCDSQEASGCKHRGDINDWDAPMDWTVPDGYVLSGFSSHHSNKREDRRWNPYICKKFKDKEDITPKAVKMSSQHPDFPGHNCIDNNVGTMCHTNGGEPWPWVAVEIPRSNVKQVKIINRANCCWDRVNNMKFWVAYYLPSSSHNEFTSGGFLGIFRGPGTSGQVIDINSQTGLEGRYVILQTRTRTSINLLEIAVFGEPAHNNGFSE